MDFLKILLSTLVIAAVTALVFLALYFIFPSVAEAQFGVSVRYTPEKLKTAGVNDRLQEEREKADGKPEEAPPAPALKAEPKKEAEPAPAPAVKEEPEAGPVAEKKAEPAPAVKEEPEEEPVKKQEPEPEPVPEPEPEPESVPGPEPEPVPEPRAELSEGGSQIRDLMESTKMQIILSFVPSTVDISALKSPSEWSDDDIRLINKIGDYIVSHGIDIEKETSIPNILKIVNSKTLPDHLKGLLDFVQNEVQL